MTQSEMEPDAIRKRLNEGAGYFTFTVVVFYVRGMFISGKITIENIRKIAQIRIEGAHRH